MQRLLTQKKSESENKIFNNPKMSHEQVSIIPTDSPKKYYIIAGVFVNQKNANKMLTKLKKWNYNAATLKDKKIT
jgi:cell division septation protein DedD